MRRVAVHPLQQAPAKEQHVPQRSRPLAPGFGGAQSMAQAATLAARRRVGDGKKEKPRRSLERRGFSIKNGLAVTYFRMRLHTIIGANPFHGPVRDGKAWVQAAMAARLTVDSPLGRAKRPRHEPRSG